MTFPATVRTGVSPAMLAKVTRLFNGSAGDIFAELFQNARRAGASQIGVEIARAEHEACAVPLEGAGIWLTVHDDGAGIDDPAALLTLGASGWNEDIARAEDPAGMGLFALAGRAVRIASCGAAGAWLAHIAADAWSSGADLPIEPGGTGARFGTSVSVEIPESWIDTPKLPPDTPRGTFRCRSASTVAACRAAIFSATPFIASSGGA